MSSLKDKKSFKIESAVALIPAGVATDPTEAVSVGSRIFLLMVTWRAFLLRITLHAVARHEFNVLSRKP
jgi:hypothetical protein